MIKVGLLGAGFMGGTHAACYEALLSEGGFKVTAVADIQPGKACIIAEKFGAKVFTTGMELINSGEANFIDICLPTYLHTEHALAAMECGCDVLIEKPVCLTEDEAVRLMEMKRKTGVNVAVGHCIRFWKEYVYLKSIVTMGTYGGLISGSFKRISPRPLWGWDGWLIDNNRSGSAAFDMHIHDVDFIRYILGTPESIKSEITCTSGNREHIFSLYKYRDAVISVEGGWDYPSCFPFEMEYRVKFEKATVVFNSCSNQPLTVYNEDGTIMQPVLEPVFEAESKGLGGNIASLGGYYNEIKYYLECLKQGQENEIASLEEGVESLKLTLKEIRAASGA